MLLKTREHLLLAKQVGIPRENVVVFLNKVDEVPDVETRELVEMEIRELLNEFEYPGDTLPVIFGSALCALEGKMPDIGEESVKKLLDVLDNTFVIPDRDLNKEPMFAAEHVYSIKGWSSATYLLYIQAVVLLSLESWSEERLSEEKK